jgi:hypothetical protein
MDERPNKCPIVKHRSGISAALRFSMNIDVTVFKINLREGGVMKWNHLGLAKDARALTCFIWIFSAPLWAQTATSTSTNAPASTAPAGGKTAAIAPGAQNPTPVTTSKSPDATKNGATMDTIVVVGSSPQDSVLPTVRPISSIYGTDLSILDTPRSVGTVNPSMLGQDSYRTINDLRQFVSGININDGYGIQSVPVIRGSPADFFVNGVRMENPVNRYPISFNSVESMDVVKGPAPAVYGPGFDTGGYVNFVTKQPYFDKQHTEIDSFLGSFVEGNGSYDNFTWQIDNGGPLIKDKLAYRFSYQQREADSYYQNSVDNQTDVYGAITYLPYDTLSFELNGEFMTAKYNENLGINRPTQALINGNIYTGGPAAVSGAYPGSSLEFGYIVPSGTSYQQKIYPYDTLTSPNAAAGAETYNVQLKTTITLPDDLTIVNHTTFENVKYHEFEPYIFTTYTPYDTLLDNRTEFQKNFTIPVGGLNIESHSNSGIDIRYEDVESFVSVFEQVINGYDLTKDSSTFNLGSYDPGTFGALPIPGFEQVIPGTNGALGEPGAIDGSTAESTETTIGLFHQNQIIFDPQWSLFYGGRVNLDLATIKDPLPPDGTVPINDNLDTMSYSVNGSLTYKPVSWVTTYVTYNRTQAVNKSLLGGLQFEGQSLAASDFHVLSELYEGGAKFNIIPDVWYAGISGYYQTRDQANIIGPPNVIHVRGVEFDTAYQPNRNFSLVANATWREGNYENLNPSSIASPLGFATNQPLDDFNAYVGVPIGDYALPGFPKMLYNLTATYQFDFGLGASVGPEIESPQNLGIVNPIIVPWQFTWNATVFFKKKNYELDLDFLNFTDERNFEPLDGGFSSGDLVAESIPFRIQGRIKIKF